MIGPVATDTYLPVEGSNYIFDIHENMDEYTNPQEIGFEKEQFYIGPRKGVSSKKNGAGYAVWKTEGNLVAGTKYGGDIRAYTDKGYIYKFDGKISSVFLGIPTPVTQATGGQDVILNGTNVGIIQEFTTASNETVLSSIKLNMKSNTALLGGDITVFLLNGTGIDITPADNILGVSALTTNYVEYTFNFSGVTLAASTKYQIKVIVNGIDASNFVSIERSNGDVYPGNSLRTIAQDNTTSILAHDAKFNVIATRPFTYNSSIKKDILSIAYIGGGTFGVTATVSSYDVATRTVTIGAGILNASYVAKFVYISAGAVANTRQVRQIESVPSATKFVVPVGFTPGLATGDTITFYNKKLSQLWFPQLRKGATDPDSNSLVSIDKEGFVNYFFFPNFKRLILWDNRIVAMGQNEDGVVYSDPESLERFTILSTTFGNDTAINYAVYQSYLLIFFESSIGLIRRIDFTNPIDGSITPIYKFNPTSATIGLYSERSFNYVVTDFLLYGSDNISYSVGISSVNLDDVKVELVPFGREISNYTKKFSGGKVYIYSFHTNIMLVYKKNGITNNFVYKENTKNRYPHKYNIDGTFLDFLYDMGGVLFCGYNDRFVSLEGDDDLGEEIKQYVAITGPKSVPMDGTTLTAIKLKIGVNHGKKLGVKMRLSMGAPEETTILYTSDNIKYIQEYNEGILGGSSIGTRQYGDDIIGGEFQISNKKRLDYFFLYITPKKYITNMLLEIKNKDGSHLYIGGIYGIYSSMSTNVVSPVLTMKDNKDIVF